MEYTNELISESSPYLLQHAHNPVHWLPWGDEAFNRALKEDKPVIISIGYSSCHWCHVMERESFEDIPTASIMNELYISIKVDREEHPDVDHLYMTAVQLMTGQGGWPLNIIALPDGRPIWGGTYFRRDHWQKALKEIARLYLNDRSTVEDYAVKLHQGIRTSSIIELNESQQEFSLSVVKDYVENGMSHLDLDLGGNSGAPKFPMPANLHFLLYFSHQLENKRLQDYIELSLDKMAAGGIYDQIGGGFSRYSTDEKWKVPHFEKMLYDNAQLISLYSKAWQKTSRVEYRQIIRETLEWIKREMTGPSGEFYSALDADSEGEEGKFYVWKKEELHQIIPSEEWEDFAGYFDLKGGKWESDSIILLLSDENNVIPPRLRQWKDLLLDYRNERISPALDDKALSSWNALMIIALLDAYNALQEDEYLQMAKKNIQWFRENQMKEDGYLWRSYCKGQSTVDGLLEDYVIAIKAWIKFYEVTAEEEYLSQANEWMTLLINDFRDEKTGLFYTRSHRSKQLISATIEVVDIVIPSPNAFAAHNLFELSILFANTTYRDMAEEMMHHIIPRLKEGHGYYSLWAELLLKFTTPFHEVAISGEKAAEKYRKMRGNYLPNAIFSYSADASPLPLLRERHKPDETLIYICRNNTCDLPRDSVEEALNLIS